MGVAQPEPLMDSLGFPMELRNKQSPKNELKNQPPPPPSQEYPAGMLGMGCARTLCSVKAPAAQQLCPSKIQAFYRFSITFASHKELKV